MGREIRKVPYGWDEQHPRNARGHLQSMCDETYDDACARWLEGLRKWEAGEDEDRDDSKWRWYWECHGTPPDDRAYYRPEWPADAKMGLQLWQNTSEGTPVTSRIDGHVCPVFETVEQVAEWAAEHATTFASHTATRDEWLAMLKEDFVRHEAVNANGARMIFL